MSTRDKFLSNFKLICDKSPKKIAVCYVRDLKTTVGYTFFELNRLSDELCLCFLDIVKKTQYIGVLLSDYYFLVPVVLGIWKSGYSFAGIGNQYTAADTEHYLNSLKVQYIISDNESCEGEIASHFYINEQKFYIKRRNVDNVEKSTGFWDMCYGIMTTGSTGQPKIIQVPWSCILLNIEELSTIFDVKTSDCIFQGSPYTFDPFFVELFLSLLNACSMMIVSNFIKLNPPTLLEVLFKEDNNDIKSNCNILKGKHFFIDVNYVRRQNVTILQITPSIFRRWSDNDIKECILSPKTSLKVLVLGGERFPKEILRLSHSDNKTRIFNIYGITELSCWGFINEVSANTEEEVSLGKPLTNILYKVSKDNELFIGSKTRICLLDDESHFQVDEPVYRATGDIVKIKNSAVYFECRNNQIVKKFGIKLDLNKIEKSFLNVNPMLKDCFCVYDELNTKLGLFYVTSATTCSDKQWVLTTQEDFFKQSYQFPSNLANIEKPNYLLELFKIPINSHGKCDRPLLLAYLRSIQEGSEKQTNLERAFAKIWCEVLVLKNKNLHSNSFTELGGSSVSALQLINKLEDVGFKVPQDFMMELLGRGDFKSCLKCLSHAFDDSTIPRKKMKMFERNDVTLSVTWKFDMGKCVDATPTFVTTQRGGSIIVGSHSSKLSCIDSDSGVEVWTITLGDRIESGFKANKDGSRGFVGCYDHFVYCVSVFDGQILWKYKTEDMVKSTPCLSSNEEILYVASYDKHLHCLSAKDGQLIKKIKLSNGGIYSSGVVSNTLKTYHTGTLDGTCMALHQGTNEVIWGTKLTSPIFASPCLLQADKIIFVEVLGLVHCFNALNGLRMWTYKANGNVYSSPIVNGVNEILFGCHDGHVYCVQDDQSPVLKWKEHLDSSVFAKPSVFALESVGNCRISVATTKGFVYLCDIVSGSVTIRIRLGGEVFSSPVCNGNRLFVGCRDNYVYALEVTEIKED